MRFRVGPWRYAVKISNDEIFHDGKKRMGLCIDDERLILISPNCKLRDRLRVLMHEISHAWLFACGTPTDAEGLCDLNSTIFATALHDFSIQGGVESLLRLTAGESPESKANTIALTNTRYCAKCQDTVAGGSVICVRSSDDPRMVSLTLYCAGCGHLQRWMESMTIGGFPSGQVVGSPVFERGDAVAEFIREFPHAAPDFVEA